MTYRSLTGIVSTAVLIAVAFSASHAFRVQSQALELKPGTPAAQIRAAPVVRIGTGVKLADVAVLRDDQLIETTGGRRLRVGKFRAIMQAVTAAQARTAVPVASPFPILPRPLAAGVPIPAGQTARELLSRPPTDVVRLTSGSSVSIAQLRAMAPYVEKKYGVNLTSAAGRKPMLPPGATVIRVTSVADIRKLSRIAPDTTVLETPSGARVTLGDLKAEARRRHRMRVMKAPTVRGF